MVSTSFASEIAASSPSSVKVLTPMSAPPFSASSLVQRVQIGKLAHAGITGGEPEIHYGDGVAGEQIVTFHRVPIQILAFKGREFLHTAVIKRRGRVAACGHAHGVICRLLCRLGVLFLNQGQLVFDVANLLRFSLKPGSYSSAVN